MTPENSQDVDNVNAPPEAHRLRMGNKLLDCVSISVAGMRDGVGPLLTVFLIQNTSWSPQHLSWVLAAPSFINIIAQIPVGILLDRVKQQGYLIAAGGAIMAGAAYAISTLPSFEGMIIVQLASGLACCLVSVGVPALSLSVVTPKHFGSRLARNEIFSKIGNFGSIAVTGYIAQTYSLHSMFYVVYILSAGLILSTLTLSGDGASKSTHEKNLETVTAQKSGNIHALFWRSAYEIFQFIEFRIIVLISFIYQFANASLFLVFEQSFVRQQKNGGAGVLTTALFVTQVVIILASLALARWTKKTDPVTLIGAGFVFILLRALVFAGQFGLISLTISQILDGCVAAILIIVPARALAQISPRHFNLMSGILGTGVAFGATLSTLVAGYLIGHSGFVNTFLLFGLTATIGGFITFVWKSLSLLKRQRNT